MFKNILVPLDLSDRHQPALKIAAELAAQGKADVTLFHVIEIIPGLEMEEEKTFYQRLARSARAHLERVGGALAKHGVSYRIEIVYGNRAAETVRHAKERATDLVILTAPQIDPNNPAAGWGSLSYKMGFLSPCPVLLVK